MNEVVRCLDLTLPSAEANLALDEALLLEAEAGALGEMLRFWEWPQPAVVLGAGCRLAAEVVESACAADGVPILRRASGGGTVMLGRGCLAFSLVLRYARAAELEEVRPSYRYILERIAAALQCEVAGTSDLALAGRKCSGNAQQRKRSHLLHHGTIMYEFDLSAVSCYLCEPARQPDYRGQRRHQEFLCNLPLGVETIKARLRECWQAEQPLAEWPEERAEQLVTAKYTSLAWLRRR